VKVKRALISVSDKTSIEDFVRGLERLGIEIISTGRTAEKIKSLGISVTEVASYTGFPEMLDGRVKTLHPKIYAGILALRSKKEHMSRIEAEKIPTIDMVVVNFYPFEKTVSKKGVTDTEAAEEIDIGGPAMLRAGAKNFRSVAAVSSPLQYEAILSELESKGQLSEKTLKALAAEAFATTSSYDEKIKQYLMKGSDSFAEKEMLPDNLKIEMSKIRDLRYGENPHQRAAFYGDVSGVDTLITGAEQIQGKELSFNNIMDLAAAAGMVRDFTRPAVSIVKHGNPCGVATAASLEEAYLAAAESDRLSAFGGIFGFNGRVEARLARIIVENAGFIECIIAPEYEKDALALFAGKKNLRIMKAPFSKPGVCGEMDLKKVPGGFLIQDVDTRKVTKNDLKVVTVAKPSQEAMESLIFAWEVAGYVKSNAIVLAYGTKTVGIGAGQMSRVDAVIIAVRKAGKRAQGSVLASDAFFPKADSIEKAHEAGIAAIIQPGGSIRDKEVIDACNRFNIPMVFTGIRHFRH